MFYAGLKIPLGLVTFWCFLLFLLFLGAITIYMINSWRQFFATFVHFRTIQTEKSGNNGDSLEKNKKS